MKFGEKISDVVAKFGGSWAFILTATFLIFLWIILNTLVVFDFISWDNYPFILLNLFLSFVAAFQAPFIMMSQRRCERKQDEAYRCLFMELKELAEKELEIVDNEEKKISKLIKMIKMNTKLARQNAQNIAELYKIINNVQEKI